MDFISRFFGRQEAGESPKEGELTAATENGVSLLVAFDNNKPLKKGMLLEALRRYHPSMSKAVGEFDPELNADGNVFGLIGWDNHVIKVIGFNQPIPADALEGCVAPSHYDQEQKDAVRAHKAHLLLFYAGTETNPLAQYHVLIAVAASLAPLGAIAILNEAAQTSLPIGVFSDAEKENRLEYIKSFPMLMLCCGFLKYEIENQSGVWMRSMGANEIGLPDLAMLTNGHDQGQDTFDIFSGILDYLQESGAILNAGETMEMGDLFIRLRTPIADKEYFLEQDGPIFVLDPIDPEDLDS